MTLFYGKAKDMAFKPDNTKAWLEYLIANDGKKIVVEVELDKAKRSLDQNAYLWGVVYKVIADHTGHSEQEIHEYMKRVCLPPKFTTILGKEIKMPASTSSLNKPQFSTYVEKIRAEVAPMGIIIPDPVQKVTGALPSYPEENNQTAF